MATADYSEWPIHRLMLRDAIRCEVYRKAIAANIKPGCTVLDIGSGNGILSLFSALAGAGKVYAVEPTRTIELARKLAKENGVADRIEFIHSKLEDAALPEKVDVIVSEWMGGFAIEENMLPVILLGRDRWLKPGGLILPDRIEAFTTPAYDARLEKELRYWDGTPYGLSMKGLRHLMGEQFYYGRNHIRNEQLLSPAKRFFLSDLNSFTVAKSKKTVVFQNRFKATRDMLCNVLAAWFRADFPGGLTLTNAPDRPDTHWGRVVFPLARTRVLRKGEAMQVQLSCRTTGPGSYLGGWSVQVGDEPWEHHGDHRKKDLYPFAGNG